MSLQQRLASNLRGRLASTESPEYLLSWGEWDIPGHGPICAMTAKPNRSRGLSGWQTPRARGDAGGNRVASGDIRNLEDQVRLIDAEIAADAQYRLNPAFSTWLMGFPQSWTSVGREDA